ncbi:MAG: AraC family transcriptional regulator [Candidatus Omnitrophota bacterium]
MEIDMIGLQPENTRCEAHVHSFWEIVVYLKGTGVHTVGDTQIPFHPGMVVCQPPDVPHSTRSDSTYQDMYLVLRDFIPPTDAAVPVYSDEENRFFTLAQMAYRVYHKKDDNYEKIVQALSGAMYQLLAGWTVCGSKSDRREKDHDIDAFIYELILNISNSAFDMAGAVAASGYCADHFRRRFKEETGTTPTEYLIRMRIDNARKLLEQQRTSGAMIKEIARLSGFSDPYYFSRLFKSKIGVSPSYYLTEQG